MLVERFFTRPSKPVMPQVLSETFKPNPPAFTRPLRWLVACMLCVGMLPMQANGADTLLAFAPYAFATERHGTINAQVAFLEVPRRHDEPDGPRMRLRVVRLPASGGNGKATPVVYLAGGPGGSGVGTARGPRWPVFDQVRRETDVLLFDQRGTGLSELPPPCPYIQRFDDAKPLDRDVALAALRDTAARCIAHWRKAGVDLAAYTTAESAADLEDLRRALGVQRISLWGMSYGTHLALASLRLHGTGIERVVLIGVEGPDDTLKLPLSADTLLAELAVVARDQGFEDLTGVTRRVLTRLHQKPARGRSLMHRGREVTLGCYDAQLAIAAALGRRSTQQMLPLALRDADTGNYDLLATLVLAVREQLGEFRAMPLAMEVASGQSPHRRATVEAQAKDSVFGDALNFPFPMIGDGLGLTDLGEAFRAPAQSDVPALLVSGMLDGRTPPANAEALLPAFRNATYLRVSGASHDDELWLGHPKIAADISDFLAGRHVRDAEVDVQPPAMAQGKLDLLLQTLGIGQEAVLVVLGVLTTLLLVAIALLRRWRRSVRIRNAISRPS
ncbi:alpha/beta hydrolase [Xanthomonas campestris pv. raphani]|uniref:alpha/beta fold hydrolase n=1 Tax=Xanthomonas campestris TaxID=339 RepID=UPI002B2325C4|nr:alpha/beta hydrolase [Xanthomonas campestris]MEA9787082.1 alpha/beta hydrolase [Xanthomonas campestris pv. raphani]